MTDETPAKSPITNHTEGPLGVLLGHIPLQSRFALTIGVVIGVFASIVAGGMEERAGQIALGAGLGVGIVMSIVLAARHKTNR